MSETVLLSKSSAVVMPPRPRSAPLERPVFDPAVAPAASTTAPMAISGVASATGKPGSDYDAGGNNCRSPPKALAKDFVRDNSRLVKDLMALLAIREATKDTAAAVVLVAGDCPSETPSTLPPASVAGIGIGGGHGDLMLVPVTKAAKNRPEIGGGGGGGSGGDQLIARHHHCEATAVAVASLLHQTATKEFSSLAGEMIAIADDSTNTGSQCNGGAKGTSTTAGSVGGAGEGTMMILHADATAPEPNAHESTALETGNRRPDPKDSEPEDETGDGKVEPPDALARRSLSGPIRTPVAGLNHATAGSVGVGERAAALSGPGLPANGNLCRPSGSVLVPPLTLEQKLDKLLDGVVKIKTDMQKRIERLGQRVEQVHLDVQLNIDSTDRALLRNDLLLIGIPRRQQEDLAHYFRCVCIALDYAGEDIPEVDIRRQQRRRRQHSLHQRQRSSFTAGDGDGDDDHRPRRKDCDAATTPILVEFMFKTMRDQFYRAYQAKRVLRLSDLGLPSNRRFYVNEALTKYNRKLMAEAVRRKRDGLLHSVYTADGLVYVQRAAGDKGTKVTSFANLD